MRILLPCFYAFFSCAAFSICMHIFHGAKYYTRQRAAHKSYQGILQISAEKQRKEKGNPGKAQKHNGPFRIGFLTINLWPLPTLCGM